MQYHAKIKEYRQSDIEFFMPNDYSILPDNELFRPYQKYSLWDGNSVKCIICLNRTTEAAFLLIGRGFKAIYGRLIIKFFDELKLKQIKTLSLDDETINKWHKFLGFEIVSERCQNIKGKNYNLWQIVWGI